MAKPLNLNLDDEFPLPDGISHDKIMTLLYVQFLAQMVLFFDNGIPPAISIKFKQELGLGDSQFGMLGSMIFVGQTLGSFLSSPVL
jgi:hypothetical protein